MSISDRLRLERERLGFAQPAFAALVGASKKTQGRWESGQSAPDADALAQWAQVGLDPLFVLVGRRSVAAPSVSDAELADFNTVLETFSALSDERRGTAIDLLSALLLADVQAGTARYVRLRQAPATLHEPASPTYAQKFHGPVGQAAAGDIANHAPVSIRQTKP